MNAAEKDKLDPGAVDNMRAERHYEARTAAWLDASGLATVWLPPESIRPPDADPTDYSDSGDLEVRLVPCEDPGDHRIVSVKHWGEPFTKAADIHYGIPVDFVHSWEKYVDTPLAVFVWNRDGTHFAIVYPERSFDYWRVKPVRITRLSGHVKEYDGYFCPPQYVSTWVHDKTPIEKRRIWNCADKAYDRPAQVAG